MCFSSPSAPPVQPLPAPPPQEQDPAVVANQDRRKRAIAAMSGFKGTVLTGPMGEVTGSTTGQPTKTVLGG